MKAPSPQPLLLEALMPWMLRVLDERGSERFSKAGIASRYGTKEPVALSSVFDHPVERVFGCHPRVP